MDPNIFKKEDAPSCLVVEKSWDEILNKPDFFEELGSRIVKMTEQAEKVGELTSESTLAYVKEAINSVLLGPLQEEYKEDPTPYPKPTVGAIRADAFWDEISNNDKVLKNVRDAIAKAYEMKKRIEANVPLSDGASLRDLKNTMNDTTLYPLRGIVEE